MNERMQELAVEASKHVTATVPFNDPSYAELGKLLASQDNTVLNAFKAKFAELIVWDCVDRIKNADMTDLEGPDPDDVLWLVERQIVKHFGVEE